MAKVLLVETVRSVRAVYRFHLERDGHEVLDAGDPRDALRLLQEQSPQLVVLDQGLQGMLGMQALMRILDCTPRLPVVLVATLNHRLEGRRTAADACVVRSSAARDLPDAVRDVLRASQRGKLLRFPEQRPAAEP